MRRLTMNPIMKKELKLGARVFRFPLAVTFYAGVMAAAAMILLMSATSNSYYYGYYTERVDYSGLSGGFLILAFVQLLMIVIIMPVLTAGSIAGERERQTLDMMLTAPVSTRAIVLGKLGASLANILVFVVSSLPAMAICFLYGGIQWQNLFYFLLTVIIVGFLSGAIGIWCSSVYKKTIVSVIMTLLIELILSVGPILAVWAAYQMKLSSVMQATGNYPTGGVDIGWLPLVLLLNPVIAIAEVLISLCNGYSIVDTYLINGVFGVMQVPSGMDVVMAHWGLISLVIMLLIGSFFLWMASRKVKGRRRNRRHAMGR